MAKVPEVVCLCGSTRFEREFKQIARRLTLEGKIVLTVHVFRSVEDLTSAQLALLDALYLFNIKLANSIHVVNIGGYQGEGTRREVAFARALGKLVTFEVSDGA